MATDHHLALKQKYAVSLPLEKLVTNTHAVEAVVEFMMMWSDGRFEEQSPEDGAEHYQWLVAQAIDLLTCDRINDLNTVLILGSEANKLYGTRPLR